MTTKDPDTFEESKHEKRTQNKIKGLKGTEIRNQIKPQPKKPIITQEQD